MRTVLENTIICLWFEIPWINLSHLTRIKRDGSIIMYVS